MKIINELKLSKDLIKFPKSRKKIEAVLFLVILDKISLRLLQQIL